MRQLRQEGWIHHVCRNSVAIFLTRGGLFLSWERGLKTFFRYVIDVIFQMPSPFLFYYGFFIDIYPNFRNSGVKSGEISGIPITLTEFRRSQ
jgi:hypothetical protein